MVFRYQMLSQQRVVMNNITAEPLLCLESRNR